MRFVTYRNNLNKIMSAPYAEPRSTNDWAIDVYKANEVSSPFSLTFFSFSFRSFTLAL